MNNKLKKQTNSFFYAFRGLFSVLNTEGHMRFHLVTAVFVVAFVLNFYELDAASWAVLTLTISSVWVTEIINTAIEKVCDTITKEYNKNIKYIKDICAGAVLITAFASIIVAFILLFDVNAFKDMYTYFVKTDIWALFVLIAGVVLGILFVAIKPEKYLGFLRKKSEKK